MLQPDRVMRITPTICSYHVADFLPSHPPRSTRSREGRSGAEQRGLCLEKVGKATIRALCLKKVGKASEVSVSRKVGKTTIRSLCLEKVGKEPTSAHSLRRLWAQVNEESYYIGASPPCLIVN